MKKLFYSLFYLTILFGVVLNVSAQTCPDGKKCLTNPLGTRVEATQIIGQIINGSLTILGSLALLMMVWGGFQWLTSAGSKDKVEKGTKTMMWAVVGVVVVLASYIMVNAVIGALTGSS